ncbi:MAG: hypothetical protein HXX20_24260 [Chloroflexi bacterium]|nr:hypothetical protein [Chloroflexota bacterium]
MATKKDFGSDLFTKMGVISEADDQPNDQPNQEEPDVRETGAVAPSNEIAPVANLQAVLAPQQSISVTPQKGITSKRYENRTVYLETGQFVALERLALDYKEQTGERVDVQDVIRHLLRTYAKPENLVGLQGKQRDRAG